MELSDEDYELLGWGSERLVEEHATVLARWHQAKKDRDTVRELTRKRPKRVRAYRPRNPAYERERSRLRREKNREQYNTYMRQYQARKKALNAKAA